MEIIEVQQTAIQLLYDALYVCTHRIKLKNKMKINKLAILLVLVGFKYIKESSRQQ